MIPTVNMASEMTLEHHKFIFKEYVKTNSYIIVQRRFRREYNILPSSKLFPSKMKIKRIIEKFDKDGSVITGRAKGLIYKSGKEMKNERVRQHLERNPSSSTRECSKATGMSQTTVNRILKKEFHMKPYKYTILQEIKDSDFPKRVTYARTVLGRGEDFLNLMVFQMNQHFIFRGRFANITVEFGERKNRMQNTRFFNM